LALSADVGIAGRIVGVDPCVEFANGDAVTKWNLVVTPDPLLYLRIPSLKPTDDGRRVEQGLPG